MNTFIVNFNPEVDHQFIEKLEKISRNGNYPASTGATVLGNRNYL
jgi:hypothetical protein